MSMINLLVDLKYMRQFDGNLYQVFDFFHLKFVHCFAIEQFFFLQPINVCNDQKNCQKPG